MADDEVTSIPDFYKGKTILITGGTGFMGKVLMEKLLWSCPELERIFLLLRPKKGKEGEHRLVDLEKSALFDRLRENRPGFFLQKVSFINGDVTQLGLGLTPEDRQTLVNSVNVIFHSAASVRFDDPLRDAVFMNTRGTREIMTLAKETKDLAVLLHVSTTYCNTDRNPVLEVLYPPHADWETTIHIAENLDDHELRILTPKYLDTLPNTYTFSKSLAEHVINDMRGDLPVVIFRPSIVVSSLSEPMPGWLENFNGPVGLLVASGKGILRTIYSRPEIKADYMPVDIAIKAMIVAAWKHGVQKKADEVIPVYNCSSSTLKDVTLQEILDMGLQLVQETPLNSGMWAPGGGITRIKAIHYIKVMLFQMLPALFIDLGLKFTGNKPMLVKVQRRIYIAMEALEYYITNQWVFSNDKLLMLRTHIRPEDQEDFSFDFELEDVYTFFGNALIGARKYLLKEADDTIDDAKTHFKRLVILDKCVQLLFWGFVFWWCINSSYFSRLNLGVLNFMAIH